MPTTPNTRLPCAVDQARTHLAAIESNLDIIHQQLAHQSA
jgi:hypothetical protein